MARKPVGITLSSKQVAVPRPGVNDSVQLIGPPPGDTLGNYPSRNVGQPYYPHFITDTPPSGGPYDPNRRGPARQAYNDQAGGRMNDPNWDRNVLPNEKLATAASRADRQRATAVRAGQSGFAQHLAGPGGPSMAKQAPYQPRMTDPNSGRKLQKGRPVPTANAAPPSPGPVTDPYTGQKMQKGNPVPTAYSGALNQQVGQNLDALGGALKAGFGSPDRGQKAINASPRGLGGPSPRGLATPSAPKAPKAPMLAAPGARGAPITASAPQTDLDKVAAGKANTPGYTDFPPAKRTKPPTYPY